MDNEENKSVGIPRPVKAFYIHKEDVSRLEFADGSTGKYFMRGGICWPRFVNIDNGVLGFAILCGQNVDTGVITVFEQKPFSVIDHVINNETNMIEVEGLSPWFNRCWNMYFARVYYHSASSETRMKYVLKVVESRMIDPKPDFPEINFGEFADFEQSLWETIMERKLESREGEPLGEALRNWSSAVEQPPVVDALSCCLAGLERYPYRSLQPKQRIIEWM
jgi:hypothetical protein